MPTSVYTLVGHHIEILTEVQGISHSTWDTWSLHYIIPHYITLCYSTIPFPLTSQEVCDSFSANGWIFSINKLYCFGPGEEGR